ncbi:DUF7455 domain-containing protein [Isoptericola croceus]|uniref:DUF7455 domain-containing protein n=1 Tax=Isoptericola croceus TaxID=3031406 RepID=UPI0023F7B641|nr:hypothetical protein [Isoptericola croceus]
MSAPAQAQDVPTLEVPGLSRAAYRAAVGIGYERCDVCAHRAYVVTTTAAGPLSWCGHHFERVGRVAGPVVRDVRARLRSQP